MKGDTSVFFFIEPIIFPDHTKYSKAQGVEALRFAAFLRISHLITQAGCPPPPDKNELGFYLEYLIFKEIVDYERSIYIHKYLTMK